MELFDIDINELGLVTVQYDTYFREVEIHKIILNGRELDFKKETAFLSLFENQILDIINEYLCEQEADSEFERQIYKFETDEYYKERERGLM